MLKDGRIVWLNAITKWNIAVWLNRVTRADEIANELNERLARQRRYPPTHRGQPCDHAL